MNSTVLSIDTYSELLDTSYTNLASKLTSKTLTLRDNLNEYETLIPNNKIMNSHKESIQEAKSVVLSSNEQKRVYKQILGVECDVAFDIEMLGVERYSKRYTVLFSLQDSLDYILYIMCGCNMRKIRNIENYILLSRGILNVDYSLLEDIDFGSLIGVDDNLDALISSIHTSSFGYHDFLHNFFSRIVETCNAQLHLLAMKYRTAKDLQGVRVVLKSKKTASIAFASEIQINDSLELISGEYYLNIKSYTKKEYLENVDNVCSTIK